MERRAFLSVGSEKESRWECRYTKGMNGEGTTMDDYRGSMHTTWNPPVVIKQEPEFDLYGDTAQNHPTHQNHHQQQQQQHLQHANTSSQQMHHPCSEFMSSPYFQHQQHHQAQQQQQGQPQHYMMAPENGSHYRVGGMGQPEEEEDSPGAPKKRGRKKKIKVEDQELPLGLEPGQPVPVIRKRGRPRKYPITEGLEYMDVGDGRRQPIKQEKITDTFKQRKRIDRFEGMPEEEVAKRTLPDHLVPNLDIVIIGINPGLFAAFKGHHYAGPGNHFWRCLFLAGLIPEPMTAVDDFKLIQYGIGFTNIVARTTRSSADLSRKEIKEGAEILLDKLKIFQPRIAVFNGKGIYEIFSGNKNFVFGRQPEPIEGTNVSVFVMPSSSARCAQLPRAVDKLPFYVALKKLRDHLRGRLPMLHPSEVTFPDVKLKVEAKEEPCDDDDAATNESDPFSTEGTDDGSSGYDGSNNLNTFHVQVKEEPGNHLVGGGAGGYPTATEQPKKRGRKKKSEGVRVGGAQPSATWFKLGVPVDVRAVGGLVPGCRVSVLAEAGATGLLRDGWKLLLNAGSGLDKKPGLEGVGTVPVEHNPREAPLTLYLRGRVRHHFIPFQPCRRRVCETTPTATTRANILCCAQFRARTHCQHALVP
ncbi:hypothetical protein V5799_022260 [Amblyomma americanum]|uniref:G/T mismatch-specific thymine DNA glycosylase n=1 Tax=Amblyomma americanum TaxID=6943 RepID=A0AAQ4FL57_AMBAM